MRTIRERGTAGGAGRESLSLAVRRARARLAEARSLPVVDVGEHHGVPGAQPCAPHAALSTRAAAGGHGDLRRGDATQAVAAAVWHRQLLTGAAPAPPCSTTASIPIGSARPPTENRPRTPPDVAQPKTKFDHRYGRQDAAGESARRSGRRRRGSARARPRCRLRSSSAMAPNDRESRGGDSSGMASSDSWCSSGETRDVRPHLAQMDVFALTSISVETFSNAALEAMACGVPVVGSRIGGMEELIGARWRCLLHARRCHRSSRIFSPGCCPTISSARAWRGPRDARPSSTSAGIGWSTGSSTLAVGGHLTGPAVQGADVRTGLRPPAPPRRYPALGMAISCSPTSLIDRRRAGRFTGLLRIQDDAVAILQRHLAVTVAPLLTVESCVPFSFMKVPLERDLLASRCPSGSPARCRSRSRGDRRPTARPTSAAC